MKCFGEIICIPLTSYCNYYDRMCTFSMNMLILEVNKDTFTKAGLKAAMSGLTIADFKS